MTTILELELTGMAHGGEAIGRHAGKVIFVPFAIPGERVRVEIVEQKANWARARLLAVLTPSPDRIEPPCPFFGPGQCGGCQWQHIAYARQVELKHGIVYDQLQRLGRLPTPPVAEAWAVALEDVEDPAWRYRNHVQFSILPDGRPALQRIQSHDPIAVDECLLLQPALDALHAALWAGATTGDWDADDSDSSAPAYKGQRWELGQAPPGATEQRVGALRRCALRVGVRTGQTLLVLETHDDQPPELALDQPAAVALLHTNGQAEALVGQAAIEEIVHQRRWRISAGSFFQVNTAGAEALLDLALDYLDPAPHHRLLDAYAGVGLFALTLAPLCQQVDAIEAAPSACADFAWNARDLSNVALHPGDAATLLPTLPGPYDGVIVDPPRTGLGQAVVAQLARLAAPRLVYVSCDPATLARDAALLTQAGYRLRTVQPLDFFPQTYHVESVALWELRELRSF